MQKTERIHLRVTLEEREKIKKKAASRGMTMSELIIQSLENHVTINLNTSNYQELVVQTRNIGVKINELARNIHQKEFFTETDIKMINRYLNQIEMLLEENNKRDNTNKKEKFTNREMVNFLEKENIKVPIFMIYDEVVNHINSQLLNFIEMLRDYEFDEIYIPYITIFLEEFRPTEYDVKELEKFSDELDELFFKMNNSILSGYENVTEDDFDEVMKLLDKYR